MSSNRLEVFNYMHPEVVKAMGLSREALLLSDKLDRAGSTMPVDVKSDMEKTLIRCLDHKSTIMIRHQAWLMVRSLTCNDIMQANS